MENTNLAVTVTYSIQIGENSWKEGGQSCGVPNPKVYLSHEDLGIEIILSCETNALKNQQHALNMFKFIIKELRN